MTLGILLGLLAALCWGIGDLCTRGAGRAAGPFTAILAGQLIGVPVLLLVGGLTGQIHLAGQRWRVLVLVAGISLINLLAGWLLVRAFTHGKISLLSPIIAGFAAVTAALSFLSGERLATLPLLGIILTVAGVIIASSSRPEKPSLDQPRHSTLALLEAIGSMLAFGVSYWALRFVTVSLGSVTTVLMGRLVAFTVFGMLGLVFAVRARSMGAVLGGLGKARLWRFVIPSVLLDITANIAYNEGIVRAPTSVVAVLSSLFSAVTVLLAWLFLRERLALWQWAGVVAILAGIALVNG